VALTLVVQLPDWLVRFDGSVPETPASGDSESELALKLLHIHLRKSCAAARAAAVHAGSDPRAAEQMALNRLALRLFRAYPDAPVVGGGPAPPSQAGPGTPRGALTVYGLRDHLMLALLVSVYLDTGQKAFMLRRITRAFVRVCALLRLTQCRPTQDR
jgi:hypothetical protein